MKDITDPVKICIQAKRLFNPAISAKTIQHAHPTLHNALDYEQKIERELVLVAGIQQTAFDAVMPIDASISNGPMKQKRLTNITCYKFQQKFVTGKMALNLPSASSGLEQNILEQSYSSPTMVTQTVIAYCALPLSSLVAILKEFAKVRQTN